jgi:hypothetical protein
MACLNWSTEESKVPAILGLYPAFLPGEESGEESLRQADIWQAWFQHAEPKRVFMNLPTTRSLGVFT